MHRVGPAPDGVGSPPSQSRRRGPLEAGHLKFTSLHLCTDGPNGKGENPAHLVDEARGVCCRSLGQPASDRHVLPRTGARAAQGAKAKRNSCRDNRPLGLARVRGEEPGQAGNGDVRQQDGAEAGCQHYFLGNLTRESKNLRGTRVKEGRGSQAESFVKTAKSLAPPRTTPQGVNTRGRPWWQAKGKPRRRCLQERTSSASGPRPSRHLGGG